MANPTPTTTPAPKSTPSYAPRRRPLSPLATAPILVPVALAVLGAFALGSHFGDSRAAQPTESFLAEIAARPGAAGGRILFADSTGIRELRLADGKKYPLALRAPNGRPMRSPALSPDGSRLVWIEESGALEAAVMQLELGAADRKPAEVSRAAAVGPVAFSSDGLAFAFAARDGAPGTGGGIVVVGAKGAIRKLAAGRAEVGPSAAMPPSFSPDGGQIAFTGREGTVEVVDASTGAPTAHFAGVDPMFIDATSIGFEWGGLRYRAAFPAEVDPRTHLIAAREFEHAISRERRRSPLAYSRAGDLAAFVRPTGRRHTFPPGEGADGEILELCVLDVPTARIVTLESDFACSGAISLAAATAQP